MRQGGAEFLRQGAVIKAAGKWNKQYLRTTDEGFHQLRQTVMEVLNTVEWNWQLRSIMENGEAERDFLFLGEDKDKQLTTL